MNTVKHNLIKEVVRLLPLKYRTAPILRRVRKTLSKKNILNLKRDVLHWSRVSAHLANHKLVNQIDEELGNMRDRPMPIYAIKYVGRDGDSLFVSATLKKREGRNFNLHETRFKQFRHEEDAREVVEKLRCPIRGVQFEVIRARY